MKINEASTNSYPFNEKPSRHLRECHLFLDLGDSLAGVQALGAGTGAVEDGVAAVQAHVVLQVGTTLGTALVSGVGQPSVRLEQNSRSEIFL